MKALIQRVKKASVSIGGNIVSEIGCGLLVFLGIEKGDTENDSEYICRKVSRLRIFEDINGKMNLSIKDIKGEILVVSQFTLAANCKKGNRPSFDRAEEPMRARELYKKFIRMLKINNINVKTGEFGTYMQINLINDGPVTFLIDSKNKL